MAVDQHYHQIRGHTDAEWVGAEGDPVLATRELGLVVNTGAYVIGDGVTAFSGLTQYGVGGSSLTVEDVQDDLGNTSLLAGTSLSKTYDDGAGTITLDVVDSDFAVNDHLHAGVYASAAHAHDLTISSSASTAYTLVIGDAETYKRFTNDSDVSVTVPPNSSVPFDVGEEVPIFYAGSGLLTLVEGAGVTVNNLNGSLAAGQLGVLVKVATDTWDWHAPTLDVDPIGFLVVSGLVDTTGTVFTTSLPQQFILTDVHASVSTADTAGLTIDVNDDGTSVLSTKLTIDAGEKGSNTAATPAVISTQTLAQYSEITIDIDSVGNSLAQNLVVWLVGYWL